MQAEDPSGETSSADFTINVSPADDDSAVNTVDDAATGTAGGDVSSTDPNGPAGGGNVTFSLSDDAGGRFAIDANTGIVTVADASLLNYEDASSHNITVVEKFKGQLAQDDISQPSQDSGSSRGLGATGRDSALTPKMPRSAATKAARKTPTDS